MRELIVRFSGGLLGVLALVLIVWTASCGRGGEEPSQAPGGQPPVAPGSLAEVAPTIGEVTPSGGMGRSAVFQLSVSHPGGASMITDVQLLVNDVLPGAGQTACWVDINGGKTVAAKNEDGSGLFRPALIGSAQSVSNSKCSVSAAGIKMETGGNEVKVTVPVTFADSFKGPKKIWVIASSPAKHSGWQQRGTWLVD